MDHRKISIEHRGLEILILLHDQWRGELDDYRTIFETDTSTRLIVDSTRSVRSRDLFYQLIKSSYLDKINALEFKVSLLDKQTIYVLCDFIHKRDIRDLKIIAENIEDIKPLEEFLIDNRSISVLNLMLPVFPEIVNLSLSVRKLTIDGNFLDENSKVKLTQDLTKWLPKCFLTNLFLIRIRSDPIGYSSIIDAITYNESIISLSIKDEWLNNFETTEISNMLKHNRSLGYLGLFCRLKGGTNTFFAITSALIYNKSLTHLCFSRDGKISVKSLQHIEQSLDLNHKLLHLSLPKTKQNQKAQNLRLHHLNSINESLKRNKIILEETRFKTTKLAE